MREASENGDSDRIAATLVADGSEIVLRREAGRFVIRVSGRILISSGCTGSEGELARIGCGHLITSASPQALVGGLGFGFTLRAALDLLPAGARITVAEIVPAVVEWNRTVLAHLCDRPLDDPRVRVWTGDVRDLLRFSHEQFDAILLDVDNGPRALSFDRNRRLYEAEGLRAVCDALRPNGVLTVWCADPDGGFRARLDGAGFEVECVAVPISETTRPLDCTVYRARKRASN